MKAAGFLIILLAGLTLASSSLAAELKTRLTRLEYQQPEDLLLLDQRLQLGLRPTVPGSRRALTIEAAVSNKVDLIIGRVREILEMYPEKRDYRIVLLPTEADVQQEYLQIYAKKTTYIAFFSPQTETVYFALNRLSTQVFAHELAHVVMNAYFLNAPPEKIHEVLAQYVEKQFR